MIRSGSIQYIFGRKVIINSARIFYISMQEDIWTISFMCMGTHYYFLQRHFAGRGRQPW